MCGLRKLKPKWYGHFLAISIFCVALTTLASSANHSWHPAFSTTQQSDTTPLPKRQTSSQIVRPGTPIRPADTLPRQRPANDTLPAAGDSVTVPASDTFDLRIANDSLDAPVDYEAEDSAVLLVKEQKFILYGNTQTRYKDVRVTAPTTVLDQQSNVLTAIGSKDSFGRILTRAVFEEKDQKIESDVFTYNFKTSKGITQNAYTKQGEFYLKAGISKKIDSNTVFVRNALFTTCGLDDPHFGFLASRVKVISNNIAVSGPTRPEFEGVPIPIYLPFGIYPLSQGRHSGILAPQFTTNQQYGLGLEGLGYYQVLNDYVDVTVRTNIYSYGGWQLNFIPQYRKRYRYSGSFNIGINRNKIAFKGDPDFVLTKTFQINWNHSMDSRAKPLTNFAATVSAGSTNHNRFIANNPYRNLNNTLSSSINYSKGWQGKPYSLILAANHNQNSFDSLINVILPDLGFTVTTQYPFQRREITGAARWYEKIGVGYNATARNQASFYDNSTLSLRRILDTLQWGAQHRFPITMQLPALGPFLVSPGVNYEETWYMKRYSRRWNSTAKKVDTVTVGRGFFTDRSLSFAMSFNTNIYGMYEFGKNSRIKAIRHVMRPTVSFNYRPNISKRNFDVIQTDSLGNFRPIPQFDGNLYPSYSYGRFGGLTFGLDNNLEMKVRGKKDTVERKVRLIDGFGFQSAYNFLDDSIRLQPFNLYLRSTLFDKISITASAILDPYETGPSGVRLNRFVWNSGRFTPGRITTGQVSASTSFQSKPKDAQKAADQQVNNTINDPMLLADQQLLLDYMQRNPAEFVDFNINWSVSLSYSLALNRTPKPDYSGYNSSVTSNVSFNNSFNLTPKWNFSSQGFYDFSTKQLTSFSMSIAREMHCWQMAISITPIGNFQFFNISLSPKSSVLKDLRVNRTRYFYNY